MVLLNRDSEIVGWGKGGRRRGRKENFGRNVKWNSKHEFGRKYVCSGDDKMAVANDSANYESCVLHVTGYIRFHSHRT